MILRFVVMSCVALLATLTQALGAAPCPPSIDAPLVASQPPGPNPSTSRMKTASIATHSDIFMCDHDGNVSMQLFDIAISYLEEKLAEGRVKTSIIVEYYYKNGSGTHDDPGDPLHPSYQPIVIDGKGNQGITIADAGYSAGTVRYGCIYGNDRGHWLVSQPLPVNVFDQLTTVTLSLPRVVGSQKPC